MRRPPLAKSQTSFCLNKQNKSTPLAAQQSKTSSYSLGNGHFALDALAKRFFSVSLVAPVPTRGLIPRQCEEDASRVAFAVAVAHARSKSQ